MRAAVLLLMKVPRPRASTCCGHSQVPVAHQGPHRQAQGPQPPGVLAETWHAHTLAMQACHAASVHYWSVHYWCPASLHHATHPPPQHAYVGTLFCPLQYLYNLKVYGHKVYTRRDETELSAAQKAVDAAVKKGELGPLSPLE